MSRLSAWLEGHPRPIRVGVVLVVAVVLGAVVVLYPKAIADAGREADANSALSYSDREIAGGNSVVADQSAVYAARALIPKDATYHVAVSPGYTGGSELTRGFVESYYRYFLMPRRPVDDAPWVICYGCDLAGDDRDAEIVWQGDQKISIVHVR
jgi:hypothetical protein